MRNNELSNNEVNYVKDEISSTSCIFPYFLGGINKQCAAISYHLDAKFYEVDKLKKRIFCNILLKDDHKKASEILERNSGKYDRPILELVSYALDELKIYEDPLKIVNDGLTQSDLQGCILKTDDLNLSLFNGNNFYFCFWLTVILSVRYSTI